MTVDGSSTPSHRRRVVLACRCLKPELEALGAAARTTTIVYLAQSLHRTPERMTAVIQEAIDRVPHDVDDVALGYGLCSNGIVGLRAPSQGLFIPRTHDCVALLLGSREAYAQSFRERPGSYYLTPGWLLHKRDPLGMLETDYIPRVGQDDAEWALREELKNYTHVVYIRTRADHDPRLRARARQNADFLGKRFEQADGASHYLHRLLHGPYESPDFLRVEAGQTVTQQPFFD